ncbi:hypothetical protein FJZ17_02820 [Candidatus Pacearchaeota archaeon]|nr:hypothetical protein [Candidatus Pacearchaeota archaeon]
MKKEVKVVILFAIVVFIILGSAFVSANWFSDVWNKITGKATQQGFAGSPAPTSIGPTQEEQNCMMACATSMGCTPMDMTCMANYSEKCQTQCNAKKPEVTEETSCMETCVLVGCGEYDFTCQNNNKEKCEKECDMIKEPEAKNAEEACIRECVNAKSPGTICQASQEGEIGNSICKECAKSCEHLYEGPCLNEEKLELKKKECQTCENCYGEPKMGPSGEGWDCIIDVECKDASAEFGDNPGSGEGILSIVGESVGNVFEAIGNFFSNIFGGDKETEQEPEVQETNTETETTP